MGLSIHYSGSFKEDASLAEMIEEVKEIAEVYKWEYNRYETGYWETGDEKGLETCFRLMENLLDQVAFGLENFPQNNNETFETYFERLLKLIHTKKRK